MRERGGGSRSRGEEQRSVISIDQGAAEKHVYLNEECIQMNERRSGLHKCKG